MKWMVLALGAPLLLAGCGSSPPTHFFTLTPVPSSGSPGTLRGKPLQVRDIELPPTMDRQQLMISGPGTQVQLLGQDRWAAPLKGLVRHTLTEDLRQRLGDRNVVSADVPQPPGGVQVLVLTVHQFGADVSGQVTLDVDWSLGRGNPPKQVMQQHETVHVSAGSTEPGAIAQAMSRALGQVADRIAGRL